MSIPVFSVIQENHIRRLEVLQSLVAELELAKAEPCPLLRTQLQELDVFCKYIRKDVDYILNSGDWE